MKKQQTQNRFLEIKEREVSTRMFLCLMAGVLLCLLVTGCKRQTNAEAKNYQLEGVIQAIDKEHHRLTIAHKEIAGYMEAMTMSYAVLKQNDWSALTVGDRVKATLITKGDETWLEDIELSQKAGSSAGVGAGHQSTAASLPNQSADPAKDKPAHPRTRTRSVRREPEIVEHPQEAHKHAGHMHGDEQ